MGRRERDNISDYLEMRSARMQSHQERRKGTLEELPCSPVYISGRSFENLENLHGNQTITRFLVIEGRTFIGGLLS